MKSSLTKYGNILTEENLALLGIYDEVYSIYAVSCEKYKDYLEKCSLSFEDGIEKMLNPYAGAVCFKPIISNFLSKHRILFSEEHPIHLNHETIRKSNLFDMFAYNKEKLCFEPKIISFNQFLKELDFFVLVRLIKINQNRNVSVDATYNALKKRVSGIIENICSNGNDVLDREKIEYILRSDSKNVWVYANLHNLVCNQQKHDIKSKWIIVNKLNSLKPCYIPINHCETCDEYYIGINSFTILQKEYGVLLIKTQKRIQQKYADRNWINFNSESELHSYGYNVVANKLNDSDRRDLLVYLINNNIMGKFAIRRDIEKAINMFRGRDSYINAVHTWMDDLGFVDKYGNDEIVGEGNFQTN